MSSSAATTSPATAATLSYAEHRGMDFSDWISPILVKELRQGLSTKVFVTAFIIVQAVMVTLLGMRLLSEETTPDSSSGSIFDALLWTALGATMLVLMPLRGMTAVSEEVKANTLDLVALTKMGSFRIVLGKWLALVSQTLLLTTAVLPYAVLRYFFGQVDIIGDLSSLGLMLCASCVLTAGCVALSTLPLGSRIVLLCLAVPGVWTLVAVASSFLIFRSSSSGLTSATWVFFTSVSIVLTIAYTLFFLLEATAKISPPAQQHPWLRRMLAMVAAAAPMTAALLHAEKWMVISFVTMTAPILIWSVIIALTERSGTLPITFVPWEKHGIMGRAAGLILHPGWPSGLLFTAIVTTLCVGALLRVEPTPSHSTLIVALTYVTIISPVVLLIFFPASKSRFGLYLLGHLLVMLWWVFVTIGSEKHENDSLMAVFPGSSLLSIVGSIFRTSSVSNALGITSISSGILLLIIGIAWVREIRMTAALHKTARDMITRLNAAEPK